MDNRFLAAAREYHDSRNIGGPASRPLIAQQREQISRDLAMLDFYTGRFIYRVRGVGLMTSASEVSATPRLK